jgi:hypothetical protein
LPPGLLALAEDDLPVPAETLHAVGTPVEGGVLVCAVTTEALAALDESVLSLHPEHAPDGVDAECADLNVLVGAFEPRPLRRARLLRHAMGAGTVLVCALLASMGLARRSSHWNAAAAADHAAWTAQAEASAPGAEPGTVLLDLQRRASRMDPAQAIVPPADAALVLTALLERWPAQVSSTPQAITIRGRDLTLSVLVDDAPGFLAALVAPPGWTVDQPMLNRSGELTRLSLTFHAADDAARLAAQELSP